MKQLTFGIITLISLFIFWDYLPGFLSLFGLTYFIWFIVGVALIHAGINNNSKKNNLTEESQKLLNQHYWK